MITVSQLWKYPFKSGKGQSISSTEFDIEGMCDDRRLLALDKDGVFITSRKHSELLQLSCTSNEGGWLLEHPAQSESLQIASESLTSGISGLLWKDSVEAFDAGEEAGAWLSDVLKMEVSIAVWEKHSRRSTKYNIETSFSDASPILVASEASVRQACEWAGIESDTRRFRPNIVLDGVEAFEEDTWRQFRIGSSTFEVLDSCVRCVLTTIQPDTGQRHPKREPMVSLMKNHASDSGQPLFGMNVKLTESAVGQSIAVGDEVEITE